MIELTVVMIVGAAGFAAAFLKLYSGFGLGTLLLPVFALLYPIPTAVSLTAIVHLASNLFKLVLVSPLADRTVLWKFGVPAVVSAVLGAFLLKYLPGSAPLAVYTIGGHEASITTLKLVIAALMLFFAAMEVLPSLKKLEFDRKYLPLGGVLSGFFGGLSGHQGAFRSAFLARAGLSVPVFVGTGVVIACGVDFARLLVYHAEFSRGLVWGHAGILLTAVAGTSLGAWTGSLFLKKIKIGAVRVLVAVLLTVYAVLLGAGIF
jgi:uncharacterized membrane protein YfcA